MRIGVAFAAGVLFFVPTSAQGQLGQRLYDDACADGDASACNVLGLMHELGEGVPRDFERAAELYLRACESGELAGCTNLGLMYARGTGVEADLERARGHYHVACEGGESLGCDLLAALDQDSEGSPLRYAKVGRVADAATGAPLPQVLIDLPTLSIRRTTDAEGRVDLGRLPEGSHPIRAEMPGYDPVDGEVDVPGTAEFLVLLQRAVAEDPTEPGHLLGRVSATDGAVLRNVEVAVVGREKRTLSDAEGRFSLRGLEPGLTEVRFTLLGYAPRTATLVVQPGRTAEIEAIMSTDVVELEPIEVTVRSTRLERNGFYRRADMGFGYQIDREALDENLVLEVSDALVRVPGVSLSDPRMLGFGPVTAENMRVHSLSLGACTLPVYIDGLRMASDDLNQIPASFLDAVEVYLGALTPAQYRGGNPCGVVLLWTKR